jgi:proline dehydrogenase
VAVAAAILGRLATRLPITRSMVARFVAGETLAEALVALERLRRRGLRTTVDVLGEAVTSVDEARAAADDYLATLDALADGGLDRNVSVKLSQMGWRSTPTSAGRTSSGSCSAPPSATRSSGSTWRTTRRPTRRSRCGASSGR